MREKLILDSSKRKFAWYTKDEALAHARKRTEIALSWINFNRSNAEKFLKSLEDVNINQ
jgi:hypothetical protein